MELGTVVTVWAQIWALTFFSPLEVGLEVWAPVDAWYLVLNPQMGVPDQRPILRDHASVGRSSSYHILTTGSVRCTI